MAHHASVAHFSSNAPVRTGAGEATSALPSRGAVAVQMAEFAVFLVRGSAAAALLSPVLLAGLLLAG